MEDQLTAKARAWLAGLEWDDSPSAEDFAALTPEQVRWHADRQFAGGWAAFAASSDDGEGNSYA